ncbi:hypothetical protein [Nocardia neocaledoniensis]|uniref:hypothetical protein n=1 Tax=Nocardia neocaledoniensis TaxID=236511 RepID=UPI0024574469|nr:hypothetical protein [Nocardia neocaledoniensis]
MRATRNLVLLLIVITAVVITVFVWTVIGGDKTDTTQPPARSGQGSTTAVPSTTSPSPLPPTVDMFGNRLEVPTEEAGAVLPQIVEERIVPTRPDYLSAPPARLQWQRIWGGAAVAVSGSDGPARIDAGTAEGFARTSQGAALAAVDAVGRVYAAPDPIWRDVVRERFYGGGQALIDRFARSRADTPGAARYVTVPEGVRIQPGYRDDLAVVQLAVRSTTGYAIATWPMVWVEGDWRIRVPDDIESLWRPATPTASITGFGDWKART